MGLIILTFQRHYEEEVSKSYANCLPEGLIGLLEAGESIGNWESALERLPPPIHSSGVERGGSYWTSRLGSQALLGVNLCLLTF